jgi:NADPH-dependent 2,4-dienoyl-CoA reductase/sulfur reductase-like enzyme
MNTELLAGTGVETKTGIVCDDRLETDVKGIFAAGDVAEFYDPIAEMNYRMGTWNNAGAHGKVVAINMAGGDVRYHDVPEYSSKLFTEPDDHAVRHLARVSQRPRHGAQDRSREEALPRAVLSGRTGSPAPC